MTRQSFVRSVTLLAFCLLGALSKRSLGQSVTSKQPTIGHTVAGTVHGPDGQPLANATVRAIRNSPLRLPPDPNYSDYLAETGLDGSFHLNGVRRGDYRLCADLPGFVRSWYGSDASTPGKALLITVGPGGGSTNISIGLWPEGVISGHVQLKDRSPVAGVEVSAMRTDYVGEQQYYYPLQITSTLDDGSYTIRGLPAGKYYVMADPPEERSTEAGLDSNTSQEPGSKSVVFRSTYYPAAEIPEMSSLVTVAAGREATAIDITLSETASFSVCGRVKWDGIRPRPLTLVLVPIIMNPRAALQAKSVKVPTEASSDQHFCFSNVAPGEYSIEPRRILAGAGENAGVTGATTVTVSDKDLLQESFIATSAQELRGYLEIEKSPAAENDEGAGNSVVAVPGSQGAASLTKGLAPPPPPGFKESASTENEGTVNTALTAPGNSTTNVTEVATSPSVNNSPQKAEQKTSIAAVQLRLTPVQRMQVNVPDGQTNEDGSFVLEDIPPGKYKLSLENLPHATYVKTIRYGGQQVQDKTIDTSNGTSSTIDIVLGRGAVSISGVLVDSDGHPVAGGAVALRQDPDPLDIQVTTSGQQGNFSFTNLAPGVYLILGLEDVDPPGLATRPSLFRSFLTNAIKVDAARSSGDGRAIQVPAVTKADVIRGGW